MATLNDHDHWTAACHHEAAHCAVALQLGLPIDNVAVVWERRGLLGRVPSGLVRIPDHITDPGPLALVAAVPLRRTGPAPRHQACSLRRCSDAGSLLGTWRSALRRAVAC